MLHLIIISSAGLLIQSSFVSYDRGGSLQNIQATDKCLFQKQMYNKKSVLSSFYQVKSYEMILKIIRIQATKNAKCVRLTWHMPLICVYRQALKLYLTYFGLSSNDLFWEDAVRSRKTLSDVSVRHIFHSYTMRFGTSFDGRTSGTPPISWYVSVIFFYTMNINSWCDSPVVQLVRLLIKWRQLTSFQDRTKKKIMTCDRCNRYHAGDGNKYRNF